MTTTLQDLEIKIINLPSRTDRRAECMNELNDAGITLMSSWFFTAKYVPDNGAAGCALSHAMAISEYLFTSERNYLLVLEDDFQIRDKRAFLSNLEGILAIEREWDFFLLGHNQAIPIEATSLTGVSRCINAQTAVAYIAKRDLAHRIVSIFFESALGLRKYQKLPEPNRRFALHSFSLDIFWKTFQLSHRFCAPFPDWVTQRPSFSDIEKKYVNYLTSSLA